MQLFFMKENPESFNDSWFRYDEKTKRLLLVRIMGHVEVMSRKRVKRLIRYLERFLGRNHETK